MAFPLSAKGMTVSDSARYGAEPPRFCGHRLTREHKGEPKKKPEQTNPNAAAIAGLTTSIASDLLGPMKRNSDQAEPPPSRYSSLRRRVFVPVILAVGSDLSSCRLLGCGAEGCIYKQGIPLLHTSGQHTYFPWLVINLAILASCWLIAIELWRLARRNSRRR